MTDVYSKAEIRDPRARERSLFRKLPATLAAALAMPGWSAHLGRIKPEQMTSRAALATLPVLRKSSLPAAHQKRPPFGGFADARLSGFARLFTSPGPIFEPEISGKDPWHGAAALYAAGLRPGDVVVNTFSYHLTPGGFIFDSAARALGCPIIPAGPGNTEQVIEVIAHYRPIAYAGTPDFLKILLDKAKESGKDISSIRKASVGGAAFPASLQAEIKARGIDAYQTYATADVGVIAFETSARQGMVVGEAFILEIVRPGTGDPVAPGEVGEILVTIPNPTHPVIRLALGDLTAELPGPSPCGRTGMRIKGWMGRADQTAKVKGMFVRPEQVAEIVKRHPDVVKARLVITRANEQDNMVLRAEVAKSRPSLAEEIAATLQAVTKLRGGVEILPSGTLPNDGKVIADERPVG